MKSARDALLQFLLGGLFSGLQLDRQMELCHSLLEIGTLDVEMVYVISSPFIHI
jgi:hypothetical protein